MTTTAPQPFRARAATVSLIASALGLAGGLSPVRALEAAATPETIVLKAAHVFDSTGTALKDGVTVVVRGDRIVSVGTTAPPAGARVIDLGDATLLPGFIDAHTHLTFEFTGNYTSLPSPATC